jgi:hypothetical protein
MKSVLKKTLLAGGALIALVAASGAGLHWWIQGKLSKEAIVAQMESSWNCRAEIDKVTLVLMSSPARLQISGCKIALRDAEVAKALAQRAPLDPAAVQVSIEHAVLEVKLQDLVSRRLNVQQLVISNIAAREDVSKEGESSLGLLFSKPVEGGGAVAAVHADQASLPPPQVTATQPEVAVAEPAPAPQPVSLLAQSEPQKAEHETKGVYAKELGFSIQVGRASLEGVSLHRVDRKSVSKTDISGLSFSISDIDVNPDDLASHNSFKLALNGRLQQGGRVGPKDARRSATLADLHFDGAGTVHPFELESGKWQPVSDLRLTLKKGSVLGGYMKLGETGSKDLKKLDDYGIDLRDLSLGGPLLEDANILVTFQNDRNTLQEDAHFAMPDFELTLQKGSWLNGAEDDHEMQVRITCGPKLQEQVSAGVKKLLGDDLGANIIKTLSDEKGRVYFDMRSSDRLSKPKVVPDVQRLLNRLLQGVGGGLLDGLLKK